MRDAALGLLGRLLEAGDDGGGGGADLQPLDGGVEPGQDVGRAGLGRERDAAQQAAHLPHRGGRGRVVPDDVADDEHRAAVGLQERVVPVAADLRRARRGGVAHDDLDVVGLRRRGEQAALQLLGELALLGEQPGVVEGERRPGRDVAGGRDLGVVEAASAPAR